MNYHAHFYFEAGSRELVLEVAQKAKALKVFSGIYPVDRKVGPHPLPMMELHFSDPNLETVKEFFQKIFEEKGNSTLIHPYTDDEIKDHTESAIWIGKKLELNMKFLEDFVASHRR